MPSLGNANSTAMLLTPSQGKDAETQKEYKGRPQMNANKRKSGKTATEAGIKRDRIFFSGSIR
jgi:hypothetical protein